MASSASMGTPGMGAMSPAVMGRLGDSAQPKLGSMRSSEYSSASLKAQDVVTSASSWSGGALTGGASSGRGMVSPIPGTSFSASSSAAGGAGYSGGVFPAGMVPGAVGTAGMSGASGGFGTSPTVASRAGVGGASVPNNYATRSHTMLGPMAGAAHGGAGQGTRSKKIKTITSRVEESQNLRALLGERPAVVPGVIGHWARG